MSICRSKRCVSSARPSIITGSKPPTFKSPTFECGIVNWSQESIGSLTRGYPASPPILFQVMCCQFESQCKSEAHIIRCCLYSLQRQPPFPVWGLNRWQPSTQLSIKMTSCQSNCSAVNQNELTTQMGVVTICSLPNMIFISYNKFLGISNSYRSVYICVLTCVYNKDKNTDI